MADEARMHIPHGFLRKKFATPRIPRPYVREERLTARIIQLASWRLCLMSSAAGYGKTALLSQWCGDLQQEGAIVQWIDLDEHDADPQRFLQSVAIALQSFDARFLQEYHEESDTFDEEERATGLINLMDETLDPDQTYVLVLDNYDLAAGERFDRLFSFFYRYGLDNFHLILAGSYLSLELSDLLVDPEVLEVTTSDLRFSEQRLRVLGRELVEGINDAELTNVCRNCDGWPMSLSFYRLAYRRACDSDDAERLLANYHTRFFERFVFDRLPSDVCEFTIETSLLEGLSPDLCAFVTGMPNARVILTWLDEHNVFIERTGYAGVYRYQGVFLRCLHDKLLALTQSQIGGLARRASIWCADYGYRDHALKYLALSCDPGFLEASTAGPTGLSRPAGYSSLTAYLLDTPAEDYRTVPFLLWISIWSAISAGRVDTARRCIKQARNFDGRRSSLNIYDYAEAICLALEGKSADSLELINATLEDRSLPSAFECLLTHMCAEDTERLGRLEESRALYQRAYSLAQHEATPFYRLFDLYLLSRQLIDLGRVDEATSYARRALRECASDSSLYAEFNTILAWAAIIRNDLDQADQLLARARARVTPDSNIDMYVDTNVACARLLQARGKEMAAIETVDATVRSVKGRTVPRNLGIELYSTMAAISVRGGDAATANECEPELDAFIGNPDVLRAIPCMQAKAEILMMRGDNDAAADLLMRARGKAQSVGSMRMLAEIAIALATLNVHEGRESQAMVELNRAVDVAMRNDNVNAFVKGDRVVRDLLLKLATSRKSSSAIRTFAKRVLSTQGLDGNDEAKTAPTEKSAMGYYALTEREREILKYLNAGMSRNEIAQLLSVSQNTVKSHLKNIYSKLGVHTRAEAYKVSPEYQEKA
jgi:LuxR family maltose regulon positive regulatory protein